MKTASFKNTDIGPIPDDWEVKKLGELCEVLDNRRVPLNDSQRKKGPYPYCGANGIVDYIDRYAFEGKVILIAEDGGNFSDFATRPIAYQMDGKFWVNNHAHVLISKEGVCQEFLFCQLVHKDITDVISGGTRAKLTRGQLDDLLMVLPPLPEQRRIAAALSDADKLVAALDKLIEKKKRVKEGAMQRLLSGETRLPGFTGKWVEKKLGECGPFRKGHGITREESHSGSIPAIRYGELYTTHHDIIREYPSRISETVAKQAVQLKKGDILFACSGETKEEIGKSAAFVDTCEAYAGGDLLILSPNADLDSAFLGYALNRSSCVSQKAAAGQGDAVVHIREEALKEVIVSLPPTLAEQRAIAAVLSDMDEEIAALARERAEAERIKQGMMQELLTGKTRLKGE